MSDWDVADMTWDAPNPTEWTFLIMQDCPNCLGTGQGDLLDEDTPCPVCEGTGLVEHDC